LQIRLAGAEFVDIRQYAGENRCCVSDRQLWRYIAKSDETGVLSAQHWRTPFGSGANPRLMLGVSSAPSIRQGKPVASWPSPMASSDDAFPPQDMRHLHWVPQPPAAGQTGGYFGNSANEELTVASAISSHCPSRAGVGVILVGAARPPSPRWIPSSAPGGTGDRAFG